MIFVDTSVWVDFFNGFDSPEKIQLSKYLERNKTIFITGIVVTEILAGIKDDESFNRIKDTLSNLSFVHPTLENYIKAAKLYKNLRSHGLTIRSIIDCIIAVLVMENSLMLLHKDRDFKNIQQVYMELSLIT